MREAKTTPHNTNDRTQSEGSAAELGPCGRRAFEPPARSACDERTSHCCGACVRSALAARGLAAEQVTDHGWTAAFGPMILGHDEDYTNNSEAGAFWATHTFQPG